MARCCDCGYELELTCDGKKVCVNPLCSQYLAGDNK